VYTHIKKANVLHLLVELRELEDNYRLFFFDYYDACFAGYCYDKMNEIVVDKIIDNYTTGMDGYIWGCGKGNNGVCSERIIYSLDSFTTYQKDTSKSTYQILLENSNRHILFLTEVDSINFNKAFNGKIPKEIEDLKITVVNQELW
jgi:hypothetical protein